MKKHRSYHLGYNIPLLLRAVDTVGQPYELSIADTEDVMRSVKYDLSEIDQDNKTALLLLKHLRTHPDVPKGGYTNSVIANIDHERFDIVDTLHETIDEYRERRAQFKVKTANMELDFSMFEDPKSINPVGWFRTQHTDEIATAVLDVKRDHIGDDLDYDGLIGLYSKFAEPSASHKDGVIARTIILTDKVSFDDTPFVIPLTTKVYVDDASQVNALLLDKKRNEVKMPDSWKVFAYRPL